MTSEPGRSLFGGPCGEQLFVVVVVVVGVGVSVNGPVGPCGVPAKSSVSPGRWRAMRGAACLGGETTKLLVRLDQPWSGLEYHSVGDSGSTHAIRTTRVRVAEVS